MDVILIHLVHLSRVTIITKLTNYNGNKIGLQIHSHQLPNTKNILNNSVV